MSDNQQKPSVRQDYERDRDRMLQTFREFDAAARQQVENKRQANLLNQRLARQEQMRIDNLLKRRADAAKQQREREQRELEQKQERERHALDDRNQQRISCAGADARLGFEPKWKRLRSRHQQKEKQFHEDEKTRLGRFKNAMRPVTLRSIMYGEHSSSVLTGLFKSFVFKEARLERFDRQQRREIQTLRAKEDQAKLYAVQQAREDADRAREALHEQQQESRQELAASHKREETEIKRAWEARPKERELAYQQTVADRGTQKSERDSDPRVGREESRPMEGRSVDPRQRLGRGDDFGRGR